MGKYLLTLTLVLGLARHTLGQTDWASQKVTFSYSNTPLHEAIKHLEESFGLRFNYNPKSIKGISVSVSIDRPTLLPLALDSLLLGTRLTYSIKQVAIVIKLNLGPAYSIKGRVVDSETGEALIGTHIKDSVGGMLKVTYDHGFFSFSGIREDSVILDFSYNGYHKISRVFTRKDASNQVLVGMKTISILLAPVETGSPGSDEAIDILPDFNGRISIRPDNLNNLPTLGLADVARAAQRHAFGNANETSAGFYLRGGTPEQILVVFDDFTLYHQDHFFGIFSSFNPEVIKSVELIKTGFDAKYGGRVSGIMDIKGKNGSRKKIKGSLGANMLSTSASLEFPLGKKVSLIVGGRRAYTDIFQTPTYQNLFNKIGGVDQSFVQVNNSIRSINSSATPKYRFSDLNLKLSYYPSPVDHISMAYFRGRDYLDASSEPFDSVVLSDQTTGYIKYDFDDITSWGNTAYSARWGHQWEKFHSSVAIGKSEYGSQFEVKQSAVLHHPSNVFELDFPDVFENNRVSDLTATVHLSQIRTTDLSNLNVGVQASQLGIQYFSRYTGIEIPVHDINEQGKVLALFGEYEAWLDHNLAITGGARLNYFSRTKRWYFSPRLAVSYTIGDLILKGSMGRYYQFVNRAIFADAYGFTRDFWTLAEGASVPVLSSNHLTLGFNLTKGGLNIDVEAYLKTTDGLIEYQSRFDQQFIELRSYDNLFDHGKGTALGLEILSRYRIGKNYTMWLGYALSRVEQKFLTINDGRRFLASHDRPHQINLMQQLQWKKHWELSANLILASGTPYSRPIWVYEVHPIGTEESLIQTDIGPKNGQRLPAYHRLDIAATYHFEAIRPKEESNGKWLKGKTGISLFNVYNRKNIRSRVFQELESNQLDETVWRLNEVKLLGFIPNFFFHLNF